MTSMECILSKKKPLHTNTVVQNCVTKLTNKKTSVKIENLSNTINFSVNNQWYLAYLTEGQKDKIASIGYTQKYEKKSKICKEG